MAVVRTEREQWIRQGLTLLGESGPEAVRVEVLARRLGVTKGGFYWHFTDRDALLVEMLQTWERLLVDEIIDTVDAGDGDGRTRLRALFALAAATTELTKVELAIRAWARQDKDVARRLRRVDTRRIEYLRDLFGSVYDDPADVEARCLLAMTLYIGNHLTSVRHGSRSRREVLAQAESLLLT
jgi:AcrR family transcriptional regulator